VAGGWIRLERARTIAHAAFLSLAASTGIRYCRLFCPLNINTAFFVTVESNAMHTTPQSQCIACTLDARVKWRVYRIKPHFALERYSTAEVFPSDTLVPRSPIRIPMPGVEPGKVEERPFVQISANRTHVLAVLVKLPYVAINLYTERLL
jgi:hypothetical protein